MPNAATPKQHMITDSRENKRNRQQTSQSDISESEEEGQSLNKKQAMETNAAPQTIAPPTAQVAPPANPWLFLQTGASNITTTGPTTT